MKRDWDLIRKLLTDIEEERELFTDIPAEPIWGKQEEREFLEELSAYRSIESRICGHFELLIDAGYIEGLSIRRTGGGGFAVSIFCPRLTMTGHDLLDTMRSSGIWEKIKSTAKDKGIELTFDAIKALGALVLKNLPTPS
jgi:Hypothetical protein (DUF2513)